MATETKIPERVFVSYSHEGDRHDGLVLDLTNQLRRNGVEAICDQYEPAPREGWPKWMDDQIELADFVLIICTNTYLERLKGKTLPRGKGVFWESTLLYQQIYDAGASVRTIPVLLPGATPDDVPGPLKSATHYTLTPPFSFEDPGYEGLYRRITNQPSVEVPTLGPRQALPPVKRATQEEQAPSTVESVSSHSAQGGSPLTTPSPPETGKTGGAGEARKPPSLADISTIIGLIVNFIAIISFVLGKTTTNELLALAGVMWIFSLFVAVSWPQHRRVATAAVCALPLLLGMGFVVRRWWRSCSDDKVCVVFAPFDREDVATFKWRINKNLGYLKYYRELEPRPLVEKNDDEEQAYAEAQRSGATLAFWGDFKAPTPSSAGGLVSSYRIFGIDVPHLSQGTLFRDDNILEKDWSTGLSIQGAVKKAVYLTKVALALAAWKRADFDTAISRLSDALEGPAPSGVDSIGQAAVYLYRARSLAQRKRFGEAIEDYKKALALNTSQTAALREEGSVYFAQNRFTEAIQSFTDCIARDPHDAVAFDGRGLAYLRRGVTRKAEEQDARRADLVAAKADIGKAINLNPNLWSAYNHRGQLHLAEDDKVSALADLESATSQCDADAYVNLGNVLMSLTHYPEAVKAYTRAKKCETPHGTGADVARAAAYAANQDYEKAIVDLTKVLACRPSKDQICDSSQVSIYESRADAYDHLKHFDEAIADLAQAVLRESDSARLARLHYNAGHVFNEKGDLQAALANLSQALTLPPGSAAEVEIAALTYYERADVQTRRGDKDHAIADLQDCLRLTTDETTRNSAKHRLDQLIQGAQDAKK
jgi:tetratricopeptide (TPR) repeat protein